MMKKALFSILLLTLMLSPSAFATVEIRDNSTKYGPAKKIVFSGLDVSESGGTHTVNATTDLTVIAASTDTPGTVTAAKNKGTFVLDAGANTVGGVGYTLTLPAAAANLEYSFITGDGKTLSVVTTGTDTIVYGGSQGQAGPTKRITSPACSGSTVTLTGTTGKWYVKTMTTGALNGGSMWTPATS